MNHVVAAPVPSSVPVEGGGSFPVRRIYCVGRNYVEHAQEMGFTGREPPFFFLKPADALVTNGRMRYPSLTSNLHYEVELVVAIGRGGADIQAARALEHVYGYAVGLDMTRRDLQNEMKKQGRPWCIGKAFDESAPVGTILPASQAGGVGNAGISLTVNGEKRQSSSIDKMIWSVPEIIQHLSSAWTLAPGDLIFTGTPEGVGAVVAGDRLEARIAGLPPLSLSVTAA
jgi:fumarylpyruvate hydrolase